MALVLSLVSVLLGLSSWLSTELAQLYASTETGVACGSQGDYIRAGRLINPTRVKYFSAKNYSAGFSETRGIDWTLLGAPN